MRIYDFFINYFCTINLVILKVKITSSSYEVVKMDEVGAEKIKNILKTQKLEPTGQKASGCINEGEGYRTDHGLVFIKKSSRPQAKIMFESEVASLSAIEKTRTIRVPHPYGAVEGSNNKFYCVLEFLDLRSSTQLHDELGENLAKLHLHNENVAKNGSSELPYVKQFGFFQTTCIGALPFDNTWEDDWPTFYTKRLQQIVTLIVDKEGPGEILPLWNELSPIIPKFFENIDVKPSLLHGDLWGGNAGETDTEPVIFDPGSLYGHHEFDIAMTSLFGGFRKAFYNSYHQLIPKAHGFRTREKLYQLFHVMNHWRHFGGGYKSQSLISMRDLIKTKFPLRS